MSKQKFDGHIGMTLEDSWLHLAETGQKVEKKTNIVYILLDDVGFAQFGCYGSNIETPNIDKLAAEGLRYNNFHTTAMCSPTRASLLTGANHHAAGVGTIVNVQTDFPNAIGHLNPEYATIAEVLKEYDYGTYAVGKWHLAPIDDISNQGPVDNWPLAKGFDKYYGFLNACTDQYYPELTRDNTNIFPPKTPEEGYHLSEDLSDQAINYLYDHVQGYPDKPFFLYLAYGAGHCPHQVPKKYVDKYKGRFDEGWDVIREKIFKKQKEIGIIPEDAKLTERNQFVPAWDSLNENQKKLFARYMEVYAGFIEHTDEQIGRVIDYINRIGERDNTIIVLLSDNGANGEGGVYGTFNSFVAGDINPDEKEFDFAFQHIEDMGGEYSYENYPLGWANAGNTPFKWYKTWAHCGGVKDPMIIRFPNGIRNAGEIRTQYSHVIDITPTVFELIGIKKPEFIKGVPQLAMHGVSFAYSLNAPQEPARKRVQYYEMLGNRGIWHDGWKLVANHLLVDEYAEDEWELYHTDVDYSEEYNLAQKMPEKVEELKSLWFAEAGKYGVFPLGSGALIKRTEKQEKKDALNRKKTLKMIHEVRKNLFRPITFSGKLAFNNRNNDVEITVNYQASDEGTLYAVGDRFNGYVLYVKEEKLYYVHNYIYREFYRSGPIDLTEGKMVIRVSTRMDRDEIGGRVSIFVNGEKRSKIQIPHFGVFLGKNLYIKDNGHTAAAPEVPNRYEYTGVIEQLELKASEYSIDEKRYLDELVFND
ncbi:MAG: arylsulfatase [Clostridiaceae bacterium]|nr:arylsulfatase [Clostridiaceae bacterium]